jgi:hypothetical protein
MGRLTALCVSLQAIVIGWLATGGMVTPSAQTANPNDDGAWSRARTAGTLEAYEGYLGQFPTGAYADQAFRCIVELTVDATDGACVGAAASGADALEGAARGLSAIDVY